MFHPTEDFHKYIHPGKRVHLAGIGGVSMCALAEVLQGMGVTVQGSDMSESDTVKHLRSVGIPVAIGHSAENLKNCDAVIRTAAIHDSNPEIAGAVARGIPVYERAQAWGAIMQGYRNAHHHLYGHPYLHGGPGRPHGDDRRHTAAAALRLSGGQGRHHYSGEL